MAGNWVKENTLTVGSGDIILNLAVTSYIRVASVFTDGEQIYYSIIDGENRENGLGTYVTASNSITRDTILETLVGGIFNNASPLPLSLSGSATVGVTPTLKGLTTNEPVWNTIHSQLGREDSGYIVPAITPIVGGILVPTFSASVEESLSISFETPHNTKPNSTVFPYVGWSPVGVDVGTVRWGIEYSVADRDTGLFDVATTIYAEQAGSGVANTNQTIEFTAATFPVTQPNTTIIGRVFRDSTHVNDTFTGTASLHTVALSYQTDRVGTPQKQVPYYTWS